MSQVHSGYPVVVGPVSAVAADIQVAFLVTVGFADFPAFRAGLACVGRVNELRRDILANQYLPEHLRERAKNDTSEYCRAEDDDDLLEIDRLAGHGLVRFHFESGNASMRMLAPKLPAGASPVLHSDMGWQYRHPWWRERLGELGIRQSMSRKGNCLDNAATEQVFGHLKDEFYRDREFDS